MHVTLTGTSATAGIHDLRLDDEFDKRAKAAKNTAPSK